MAQTITREREVLPYGFSLDLDLEVEGKTIITHQCDDGESGEADLVVSETGRKGFSCLHCHWAAWMSKLQL